ncbi:MAG: flagellar biosynthetic protein FliO [Deltaproteobacteria bacterium]|nr:flagellar biosynthetic protein FliO [Deltaproteobacteria bacterium]
MRHFISLLTAGILMNMALSAAASPKPQIAAFTVENMPSTDVVRFAVSPAKDKYEYKVVCGDDSIRIRLLDIGMADEDVKYLDTPRGSTLRKVRVVPQLQNRTVLQIHPSGSVLEACARTSVMSLDGNVIVSIALSDSQKRRRTRLLDAEQESREALKRKMDNARNSDTINAGTESVKQTPASSKSDDNGNGAVAKATSDEDSKSLTGTIFDKSSKKGLKLRSDEEVNAQTMKYAGGLLFAAMLGFVAWYMSKKRNRFHIDEDNIDILSRKKVGTHQTLMVARVNGSRFLLAVGDKTVSSLGLIPSDEQSSTVSPLAKRAFAADIQDVVKESLAKEPRISATPYSDIRDDDDVTTDVAHQAQPATNFGSDFQQAIEKIVRERNKPIRSGKARTDAGADIAARTMSEAFSTNESASNVSGLISMARMRAALENQSTPVDNQYRA